MNSSKLVASLHTLDLYSFVFLYRYFDALRFDWSCIPVAP